MASTPQGRRSKLSDLFIPPTINPLAIKKKMMLGGKKKCAIALLIIDITHTHIYLHIYVYISHFILLIKAKII